MAQTSPRVARAQSIVLYSILGLWSASLVINGILFMSEAWGPAATVAGGLSAVIVGVSAWLRSWLTAVYGVLLVTAGGLLVAGVLGAGDGLFVGFGILGLVVVGATVPVAMLLSEEVRRPAPVPVAAPDASEGLLQRIHENTMLSDGAKRLLYRERELGLLRQAIEQDIAEGKYNVALALCDEMADVFGFVEEAEAFRGQIIQARREHYDHALHTSLEHLDQLLGERNWAAVHHEAARIRRLFGDSHQVQDLDERILNARAVHKNELETEFLEAARRDDVPAAMRLLKQLDRYLDRVEAERLSEVAEGIVVRHRKNLSSRFKDAVNEHQWADAAQVGETIIEEFPNTTMAEEVRGMIDLIRTRATQAAVAGGEER